jgi:hypothetical protein
MSTYNIKPPLVFGGAGAVNDPELKQQIHDIIRNAPNQYWLDDSSIHTTFLDQYIKWILSTRKNVIRGLDQYAVKAFSQGTTESFDKFYLKHHRRRFRCFRGEYMYHTASWKNIFSLQWKHIEDEPIDKNDAVVISLPFSDTGDYHNDMNRVLEQCCALDVPVLIDCAFFGICQNLEFDFTWPCITDITFSLSKTLPVAHARIGMRVSRVDDDDSLMVHQKIGYVNRLACGLGIELLGKWGPDYNCEKWTDVQHQFCNRLNIIPSNSVIFGIDKKYYKHYNRGGPTNRLWFGNYMYHGQLPNE